MLLTRSEIAEHLRDEELPVCSKSIGHCASKLLWNRRENTSAIGSGLKTAAQTHLLHHSCRFLLFQTKLKPKEVRVLSSSVRKTGKTGASLIRFCFTTVLPQTLTVHKLDLAQTVVCIPMEENVPSKWLESLRANHNQTQKVDCSNLRSHANFFQTTRISIWKNKAHLVNHFSFRKRCAWITNFYPLHFNERVFSHGKNQFHGKLTDWNTSVSCHTNILKVLNNQQFHTSIAMLWVQPWNTPIVTQQRALERSQSQHRTRHLLSQSSRRREAVPCLPGLISTRHCANVLHQTGLSLEHRWDAWAAQCLYWTLGWRQIILSTVCWWFTAPHCKSWPRKSDTTPKLRRKE